jgi:hypothetical protein
VNPADGRLLAIGVVVSVVAGFGLMAVTDSAFWIYAGAGVGIALALRLPPKIKGDE